MIFYFLSLFVTFQAEPVQESLPFSQIKPPQSDTSYEDLLPLEKALDGVRVLGLGGANHGTSEFMRHKSRLVRFLVEHHGFRVFLLESGFFNCEDLNAYVQGADVSLLKVLHKQQNPTWETHEMKKLFSWMRQFNAARAPEQRLKVSGFDTWDNGNARTILSNYLKKKSPNFHVQINGLLLKVPLTGLENPRTAMRGSSTLQEIEKHFQGINNKAAGQETSEDFNRAWRALQVLKQACAHANSKNSTVAKNVRDYFMAENVKALLGQAPEEKMMIWAHNSHVVVGRSQVDNGNNLGGHLRKWLKQKYFALGFGFGEGTFRAYGNQDGRRDYFAFPTGKPFPGSIGAYLKRATQTASLLVIRGLEPLPAGLLEPLKARWSEGVVEPGYQAAWQNHPQKIVLAEQFDAFIHIPTIHAAVDINAICPR